MKNLLLVFLLLNYITGLAQPVGTNEDSLHDGMIKGNVIEEKSNVPIEYANVVLYTTNDSVLVTGSISDKKGRFEINNIPDGNYYLVTTYIGYKPEVINSLRLSGTSKVIDAGKIVLSQESTTLQKIEVTDEKDPVEYHIDKKVINVDNNLVSAGGSAIDALETFPSVNQAILQ